MHAAISAVSIHTTYLYSPLRRREVDNTFMLSYSLEPVPVGLYDILERFALSLFVEDAEKKWHQVLRRKRNENAKRKPNRSSTLYPQIYLRIEIYFSSVVLCTQACAIAIENVVAIRPKTSQSFYLFISITLTFQHQFHCMNAAQPYIYICSRSPHI